MTRRATHIINGTIAYLNSNKMFKVKCLENWKKRTWDHAKSCKIRVKLGEFLSCLSLFELEITLTYVISREFTWNHVKITPCGFCLSKKQMAWSRLARFTCNHVNFWFFAFRNTVILKYKISNNFVVTIEILSIFNAGKADIW